MRTWYGLQVALPSQSKNSSSDWDSESRPKLSILQFATCKSKLLIEDELGEWSVLGCHFSSLLKKITFKWNIISNKTEFTKDLYSSSM